MVMRALSPASCQLPITELDEPRSPVVISPDTQRARRQPTLLNRAGFFDEALIVPGGYRAEHERLLGVLA